MSKKHKKKKKQNDRYYRSHEFFTNILDSKKSPTPKDIHKIALQVFGSLYFQQK